MIQTIATRIAVWLLNKSSLSLNNRSVLTAAIVEKNNGVPLRDIITINEEGILLVNGSSLDFDNAMRLRMSAQSVLNQPMYKFVRDQVYYQAITLGVHKAETPDQMYFARSAIWWMQQQEALLRSVAGNPDGQEREPAP